MPILSLDGIAHLTLHQDPSTEHECDQSHTEQAMRRADDPIRPQGSRYGVYEYTTYSQTDD